MPVYYKGIIGIICVLNRIVRTGRAVALGSPGGSFLAGSAVARATFRLSTIQCRRDTNLSAVGGN
jgi:hypothetical protein